MIRLMIYWGYYWYYLIKLNFDLKFHTGGWKQKDDGSPYRPDLHAALFALKAHHAVRQRYDDMYPYYFHVKQAYDVVRRYTDRWYILQAILLHDILEDTHFTYNDLLKHFDKRVVDIVYALTNEKGRNRKQRANDKYYAGIVETEGAAIAKIGDRIANSWRSRNTDSGMVHKYREEQHGFIRYMLNSVDASGRHCDAQIVADMLRECNDALMLPN